VCVQNVSEHPAPKVKDFFGKNKLKKNGFTGKFISPYVLRQWGTKAEGKGAVSDCRSEVSCMQKSVLIIKKGYQQLS